MAEEPDFIPQLEEFDIAEDFDPDDDVGLVDTVVEEPLPYGFTWKYDFNGDQGLDFSRGNPPITRGHGTLHEWITHTINTQQFETPIFGSDVGTQIYSLIGSTLDSYILSLCKEQIIDAVTVHDRVEEITDIMVFAIKGNTYAYFMYETDDSLEGRALFELR